MITVSATHNPSSNAGLHTTSNFSNTYGTEDHWTNAMLLKLILFDLDLAAVLTVHAFWFPTLG